MLIDNILAAPHAGFDQFFGRLIPGLILEFGVASGGTLRHIANLTPRLIYGFDSFEGLPESWRGNPVGLFQCDPPGNLPPNVKLVKGLFDQTLPGFLAAWREPIAFMHIDCDLYSSTKTVLDNCAKWMTTGTLIAFDEIYGYEGYEACEYEAFREFLANTGYGYRVLGRGGEQATFVIEARKDVFV